VCLYVCTVREIDQCTNTVPREKPHRKDMYVSAIRFHQRATMSALVLYMAGQCYQSRFACMQVIIRQRPSRGPTFPLSNRNSDRDSPQAIAACSIPTTSTELGCRWRSRGLAVEVLAVGCRAPPAYFAYFASGSGISNVNITRADALRDTEGWLTSPIDGGSRSTHVFGGLQVVARACRLGVVGLIAR
jgi:hypothetical protein